MHIPCIILAYSFNSSDIRRLSKSSIDKRVRCWACGTNNMTKSGSVSKECSTIMLSIILEPYCCYDVFKFWLHIEDAILRLCLTSSLKGNYTRRDSPFPLLFPLELFKAVWPLMIKASCMYEEHHCIMSSSTVGLWFSMQGWHILLEQESLYDI